MVLILHLTARDYSPQRAEEGRGITPEMCLPIAPNEWRHPLGRQTLQTIPPFPFPNCYHWPFVEVDVRVRASTTGFNTNHAIKLPPDERVMKNAYFSIDITKSEAEQKRQQELAATYSGSLVADVSADTAVLLSTRDPVSSASEVVPQTVSAARCVYSENLEVTAWARTWNNIQISQDRTHLLFGAACLPTL
ncbi:hypothetical protein OH76DRAFT_647064 [Lentinus brumalis]|uniref:Uncharacterized protein n=1 Tax=Lentinus brumalis TaxID=2498619 RepID=A0A371D814_9APHY|nr:hypothetical protein OH76DRAFT_647064 [Polyporus brumalis]